LNDKRTMRLFYFTVSCFVLFCFVLFSLIMNEMHTHHSSNTFKLLLFISC
jgi:hypothetical protein